MNSSDRLYPKSDAPEIPGELDTGPGLTLYVYEDAERIGWSTQLRTLLGQPGADLRPDPLGFAEQLAGTLGGGPRTLFAHIRRMPPGMAGPRTATPSAETAAKAFEDALDERVRVLVQGEAQPALLLGDGLYSRLLAVALQRSGRPFVAATLRTHSSFTGEIASAIAQACGARAIDCDWGAAEQAQALSLRLSDLDEPTATPADFALATVSHVLKSQGATLLLSGHAGSAALELQATTAPPGDALAHTGQWLHRDKRSSLRAGSTRPRWTAAQHAVSSCRLAWVDTGLRPYLPMTDPGLPRPGSRSVLSRRLEAASAANGMQLHTSAEHVPLRVSARPMLQPWQGRLGTAIRTLEGSEAGEILDLRAIADLLGSYYVGPASGQPANSDVLWRVALLLLWWTEVLPTRKAAAGHPSPAAPTVVRVTARPTAAAEAAAPVVVAGPSSESTARPRLVIYTALVGAKESLANPLHDLPAAATSDLDIDFVCITDNPNLRSPVWRMELIANRHLPAEKLSRRSKALPHLYFPEHRYSLYIDNTVSFKRLPQASDLQTARPYLFKAFRHATRDNPEQEATAVAMLGYEDVGTICRQMDFYAHLRPLATISPLTTATVLLREHAAPEVQQFGTLWWESVLAFSKRDQLSFDFALQESACVVEYFEGHTHDSPLITWNGGLAQNRVRASFDSQRYAWLHRSDPEAQRDPRAHFLSHHHGNDSQYQKQAPLLEYLCWAQGSSLGLQVSPRRGLTTAMEGLLAPHRKAGQRFLLLRVQGGTAPQSWLPEEHESAARALSAYLGPAVGTLMDVASNELDTEGRMYVPSGPSWDIVILLGATSSQALASVQMIHRMVNSARGALVLALCDSLALHNAARLETWLASQYGAEVRSQLHASRHDDITTSLPNTLMSLNWQPADAVAELAS